MKPVFTAVEMFAGAGGAALGLKEAGFYSLAAIEMWDVAAKTLRAAGFPVVEGRVEDPKVVGSVEYRVKRTGRPLDLLWASPPCQPYSSSGLRLGEVDERDGWGATLMYVAKLRPRMVVIENVDEAPVEEWAAAIAGEGHLSHAGAFRLKSSEFGDAQVRPRAFVYAGPVPLAEFLREMRTYERPARTVADVLPHLAGHYVRSEHTTARARPTEQSCPTLTTKGNLYVHKKDIGVRRVGYRVDNEISRRATIPEFAVLQGFPDNYPFTGKVDEKYRQIGNAVSPSVARAIGLSAKAILSRSKRSFSDSLSSIR